MWLNKDKNCPKWVDLFVLAVLKNALSNKYNNEKIFASTWSANYFTMVITSTSSCRKQNFNVQKKGKPHLLKLLFNIGLLEISLSLSFFIPAPNFRLFENSENSQSKNLLG